MNLVFNPTRCFLLLVTAGYAVLSNLAVAEAIQDNSHVLPRGGTITLNGTTAAPSLTGASVEVEVGQAGTFNGQTDSNGRYSVDIDCATDPDAFVIIRINGSNAQSAIGAARTVASCDVLQTAAGADNVFEVGPVTPISTAVYATLIWTLEAAGQSLSNPRMNVVAPLQRTLQLMQVDRIVRVLPALNAAAVSLPVGASTSLEVVLDRPLFEIASNDVDASVPAEEQALLLREVEFNTQSYLPPQTPIDQDRISLHFPNVLRSTGGSLYLDIQSDATGEYFLPFVSGAAAFTFRNQGQVIFADGGEIPEDNLRAIRVEAESGEPLVSAVSFPFIGGQQVEQNTNTEWIDIRVVDASETFTLVARNQHIVVTYPNNPEIPDEVFDDASTISFSNGLSGDDPVEPWPTPVDSEERLLPIYVESAANPGFESFYVDRLTFSSSGTAQALRSNLTYNWSIDQGLLVLESATNADLTYELIAPDPSGSIDFVTVRASDNGNPIDVSENRSVVVSSLNFVPANVPDRYVSVGDLNDLYSNIPAGSNDFFSFELRSDGTGWAGSVNAVDAPEPPGSTPLVWSVNAQGDVVINREFSPGFNQFRSWTLVAQPESNDVIILEVGPVSVFSDPMFELPFAPGRLNWYRTFP